MMLLDETRKRADDETEFPLMYQQQVQYSLGFILMGTNHLGSADLPLSLRLNVNEPDSLESSEVTLQNVLHATHCQKAPG